MRARTRWFWFGAGFRAVALGALSPLMEKDPRRVRGLSAPVVLSMSRLIVLAFATIVLRRIWRVGVAGWPEAAVSVAIVLALPILSALERASPQDVLAMLGRLVDRLGVDSLRTAANVYGTEPSKYDDHASDGLDARRGS
jgi:hypothetical protein